MPNKITIPASVFLPMMAAAHKKLLIAKNIIIEENEISYIILAEPYSGDPEIATHATKHKSVLGGTNGSR